MISDQWDLSQSIAFTVNCLVIMYCMTEDLVL